MIYQGCALAVLPSLEAQSVQCCVTSPPYWGLRDYGVAANSGARVQIFIASFVCEPKRVKIGFSIIQEQEKPTQP